MNRIWKFATLIIMMLWLCLPVPSQADGPIVLSDEQMEYPIGTHLEYFKDDSGTLTIEQIMSPAYDSQFIPNHEETLNFSYTSAAYWIRFQLENPEEHPQSYYLETVFGMIDELDFYQVRLSDKKIIATKRTVDRYPFVSRDFAERDFTFHLELPYDRPDKYLIYLRGQSQSAVKFDLTLWSAQAMAEDALSEYIIFGLLYGFIIIMIFYNLALYFLLRDPNYLYYVLLMPLITLNLATQDGFSAQYLWPQSAGWSVRVFSLSGLGSIMVGLMFMTQFLNIKKEMPRLYRLIIFLAVATMFSQIVTIFFKMVGSIMMAFTSLATGLMMLVAGIISWRRGNISAFHYLISWIGIIIGSVISVLGELAILPEGGWETELSIHLGTAYLAVMLSAALAARINELRRATEQANQRLQESEKRVRQFMKAMPVGVFIQDMKAMPFFVNRLAQQLFGATISPTTLPTSLNEITITTPLYIKGTNQPYPLEQLPSMRALRGETVRVDDLEALVNNKRIPLEIWASPIFNGNGKVHYAISAFQDITERQQAEQERLKLTTIQQELNFAQTIQKNLLPPATPNWPNLQVTCCNSPAREVGGDLYIYHTFNPNHYVIAVGDVTGKGMAAALLMAVSQATFQTLIQQDFSPTEFMAKMDLSLKQFVQKKQNCALVYAQIDLTDFNKTGLAQLTLVNAGCPMPIIKQANGSIEMVDLGGMPLGVGLGSQFGYATATRHLRKGDVVILASDGVVEANNAAGEMFGFERLEQHLQTMPTTNAEISLNYLKNEVLAFVGGAEQHDDMTIAVMQI